METQLTVRRLTGAIGAEVKGIDLSHPLGDPTFATIHRAFLDHCMLVFRGQFLEPAEQAAFTRCWGEVLHIPYLKQLEMPAHEEVMAQPNLGKAKLSLVTEQWHSDSSFLPAPPAHAILAAHVLPEAGGDTMFANQYLAYETLSEGMQCVLQGLRALHRGAKLAGVLGIEDSAPSQSHPVVRTHLETGRPPRAGRPAGRGRGRSVADQHQPTDRLLGKSIHGLSPARSDRARIRLRLGRRGALQHPARR
jgi:alpha-ketoglutarate-dependent taurine dioxygenase